MSVRIYQLSKKLGMENSDLIDLLRDRGYKIKSASSTIDNISAESLLDELKGKAEEAAASKDSSEGKGGAEEPTASTNEMNQPLQAQAAAGEEEPSASSEEASATPSLATFVKSKAQVQEEKDAAKKRSAPQPPPRPAPSPPSPAARPAAPQASAPSRPAPPRPPASPGAMGPPSAPKPPASVSPRPASPPRVGGAAPSTPSGASDSDSKASPEGASPPSASGQTPKDASDEEIRTIVVKPPIVVRDLAQELGLKPFKLISELMAMGVFASINQSLDEDTASRLAANHGVLLEIRHRGEGAKKKVEEVVVDETAQMETRPPVVCVLGHIDHGKTTLLDQIRKAKVVEGEAGGITQHIGAYQVERDGKKISFLDTPGHAAFNKMRARGADVTDIAVLVVAADDGFMPQTDEALKFIQAGGVQPIVAINKIDTPGANIDRVKQQMQERGIAPEDWGGEVIAVPVSALKGEGIDELLEMINLQAEVLELKANPQKPAEGVIIESRMEVGRGSTATVIVQAGTLRVGDAIVSGYCYTKVKAMFDEDGKAVKVAPPSTPVRVIGWSETPECGATFHGVKNEKAAKREAEDRLTEYKRETTEATTEAEATSTGEERLFAAIAATRQKSLRLVVKGDAYGSVEAVLNSLESIKSDKVRMDIIGSGVGDVSPKDVQKASAGGAEIIGFNVRNENGVQALAKRLQIKISHFQIIYELIDRIREDMVALLDPELRENKIGAAEVRAVFPVARGFVAGCLVVEGRIALNAKARLVRKGVTVAESSVENLRRVKDEVKEVRAGTECGARLKRVDDYQVGDIIEVFEVEELRPSL